MSLHIKDNFYSIGVFTMKIWIKTLLCALFLIAIAILCHWICFFAYLLYHSREEDPRRRERNAIFYCESNMRHVADALEAYHDDHGAFPPPFSVDKRGNPLHSWRVLILPYMESHVCKELYDDIRLDEPWDSTWNEQFHDSIPDSFQCMLSRHFYSKTGGGDKMTTHYYMVIDEHNKVVPRSGILFAERENGHNWMDPNHEIRLIDAKHGINTNPAGITSTHVRICQHNILNVIFFESHTPGANICTFHLEVKWVPESTQVVP